MSRNYNEEDFNPSFDYTESMKKIISLLVLLACVSCGKNLEEEKNPTAKAINKEDIQALYENKLYSAINSGDSTLVKDALENIKEIDKTFDENGETALTMAIKRNQPTIIKLLMKNNPSLNVPNKEKQLPSHLAIESVNQNIPRIIFKKNSDFQIIDKNSISVLEHAVDLKKEETAIFFVLHGASIDERTSTGINITSLAKRNSLDTLVKLISDIKIFKQKNNTDIDFLDEVKNGNVHFVEYVLHSAEAKNIKESHLGKGVLNTAIKIDSLFLRHKMLLVLLSHGFDANGEKHDLTPPLFTAIDQDDAYIISLLVNKGVKLNHVYGDLKNPLSYAVRRGSVASIEKILDFNAHIQLNVFTESGYYVIDACEYLPKRRLYRNSTSLWGKRYQAIEKLLSCD